MGSSGSKEKDSSPQIVSADGTTITIPFIWSSCEFDPAFPRIFKGKINPAAWTGFIQTINYDILSPYGAMYCDPVGAAVAARAKRRMAKAKGRTTIGGATQSDKTVVPMSSNEAGSFKISKAVQTKQRMPNWEDKASPAVRAFLQRTVKAVEARGDPITLELALSKAMVSGEQLRELAVARMKAELGAVPGMPPTREAGEVEVPCIMMSVVSAAAGSGEVVFFDSTGPTESLGLEVPPNTVTVVVTPDDGEPYVKIKGEGMPGVDGDGDGDGDAAAETEMMQEDALEHLKHTALIIVDVQNDFVTGTLKVDDAEAIVPKINALRAAVPFGFVCHSQDSHPADHCSFVDNHDGAEAFSTVAIPAPDGSAETVDQVMWPRHCVVGTPGWEFHPDLAIPDTDYIQAKGTNSKVDSYSAFFDNFKGASTGLESVLEEREITDVFVVGLATDFCVGLTAVDAAHLGFNTFLVDDCARGVAADTVAAMKERLVKAGVRLVDSADIFSY